MVDATAYTEVFNLVMLQAMTLEERLACILTSRGGRNTLNPNITIDDVFAFNGMSGYNYWADDKLIGQLYIGTLQSGTYVIYKRTFINDELQEVYDYYDQEGKFFYTSNNLDGNCIQYSSIAMDPFSPFINHIYNILHLEYQGTTFNFGNTQRIKFYEDLLNKFKKDKEIFLSVEEKIKDKALLNIKDEILKIEKDGVLKWTERQEIFKKLREVRGKILATKRRAHGYQFMLYDFIVMCTNLRLKWLLFKQRPMNNFLGSAYQWTFGKMFWFVRNVRENIGFSIAMAIYGPFTFYFITQPMNPHAMWAVGKVRSAYIQVSRAIEDANETSPIYEESRTAETKSNSNGEVKDKVSVKQAAVKKISKNLMKIQDWDERMSSFKAMQIAYEGDMVFAARMGRIEQFETQFNFPLTAEAAWMEMELYLKSLDATLTYNQNLDERYARFLKNEKERTLELQFYVWQKVGQFFLDHPYIVVDEEKEQPERNYYLGRQFVFFKKMTEKLTNLGMASSPVTHKNIEKLAEHFKDMKVEGSSVMDTLKKNSKLFQQKNFLSSDEHRDYMKRQWEVLFLQQNKKQEASSFALQAYTWSVKNAIWLLQTIYSAKRSELGSMTYKYNLDNTGTQGVKADPNTNEYLENMFHNLAMEFVSIKKEVERNLKNDNESQLRESVINNIKQYIIERDKLFNTGIYASVSKEGNTI